MDKMKFETPDMAQMNVEKIAALFPNCVTESKAADGKLKKAVNFDALKQMLGESVAEDDESYEFTWVGKRDAMVEAAKPIRKTLRPCVEESKNFDTTENLYIEGDNLEALKLLQEGYLGKVKMIYIDPPYNTGNDFIYKDDFRMDSAKYAEESGAVDDEGNRMVQNSDSNGRFHSDWCSMIYSRLLLARNLLTDDGVILVNMDENEITNLQNLTREVFGEANELGVIVWDKRNPKGDARGVSYQHEYIVLYARDFISFAEKCKMLRPKKNAKLIIKKASQYFAKIGPNYTLAQANDDFAAWMRIQTDFSGGELAYNKIDENGKVYQAVSMSWPNKKKAPDEYFIPLIHPITKKPCPVPERGWRNPPETMKKLLSQNEILFGVDENTQPRRKYLLEENMMENIPSLLYYGGSDTALLKEMNIPFDTPKVIEVCKEHIQSLTNNDSIILDFFSGSATTAHAVMQLNAEDGGHRKFIMVQLPEKCDENSEAAKAGYKTICEIGKERIRRAGDQILELSLQNLEKEGIVEKYARELPEIRSLEEVYGSSGIGLRLGEEVAEGGNIRSVGSNSQGCGVDSVEHSGGAISGEQGVCPVFENSKGITSGTGNTIVDLRTLKILNENGYRIKLEALGRNQQNDLFADKAFDIKGLSSKLSVLNSDRGFRVLKIDDSNMKDVYYSASEISQQDLVEQISNIKDGRTDMDLLFGCLVDWGVPLSLPIKTETIENLQVYNVNDGDLVACFANDIPEAAIRQIAAAKPLRAVFRDSSFKSDSAKINVTEIFKTISPNTTVKVV